MRKIGCIVILVALLFGMALIPPIDCQNSDGLTWGVTEDQTFRFLISTTSIYTPPLPISELYQYDSHVVSRVISYLPNIPTAITNWTEIPYLSLVPYFIDFWIVSRNYDVLPVGNWTLLQNLDSSSWLRRYNNQDLIFKNASYFENSTCWGYQFSYNTSGAYKVEENVSLDCTVIQAKLFSKIDGVLIFRHTSLQFYEEAWGTYNFGRIVETAVRIEKSPVQDNTIFILVGGGSLVAIILVISIYKVKTGKG